MNALSEAEPMTALVAMGGNVGSVSETFRRACDDLNRLPGIDIAAISPEFPFPAVGSAAGNSFWNAAARLQTTLAPLPLLDVLQQIENRHGRVRTVRWGPRMLDLDLICHGESVLDTPRLRLPHPACWYRRFVLDPVTEIAGDVVHPVLHCTFRELRNRLLPRPLIVGVIGDAADWREIDALRPEFPRVHWVDASAANSACLVLRMTAAESASPFTIDVPVDDRVEFVGDVLQAALGL